MTIAVGSDHAGFHLKQEVAEALRKEGHEVLDVGTQSTAPVDYPDFAEALGLAVRDGRAEKGVLICGSGVGAAVAANKVPGVRAALCADAETARGARRWNDANVLALSLRTTSEAVLGEILDAWFAAGPSPDAGDAANVEHLAAIERD
jgi:ribose 5-phosphate isomerase B